MHHKGLVVHWNSQWKCCIATGVPPVAMLWTPQPTTYGCGLWSAHLFLCAASQPKVVMQQNSTTSGAMLHWLRQCSKTKWGDSCGGPQLQVYHLKCNTTTSCGVHLISFCFAASQPKVVMQHSTTSGAMLHWLRQCTNTTIGLPPIVEPLLLRSKTIWS